MGPVAEEKVEELERMVETNMAPYLYMTWAILPKMLEREKKGAVIFTSSVAGILPLPYAATYAATKAFNKHLAEGLAYENP